MKILAVDIGGTMIKTGLLNSHGERIQLGSFPDIRQKWTRIGKTVIFDKDRYLLTQQMKNDGADSLFPELLLVRQD